MAIAVHETLGRTTATSSSPTTASLANASGSNCLVVAYQWEGGSGGDASAMSYNGVALTKAIGVTQTDSGAKASLWYLFNPASGTNTLSVTHADTNTKSFGAWMISGADTSAIGATNSRTYAISSTTIGDTAFTTNGTGNGLCFASCVMQNQPLTASGSPTELYNQTLNGTVRSAACYEDYASGANPNIAYTIPSTTNSYGAWVGLEIKEDPAVTVTSERDAKIVGSSTANAERDAKVTGAISVSSERDAKVSGVATASDERDAKVTGSLSTSDERDAFVSGTLLGNDERDAKVSGTDTTSSERDAKVVGALTSSSERSAKITGRLSIGAGRVKLGSDKLGGALFGTRRQ